MQADSSCSRQHAAIVHHQDGRIFVIDLESVRYTRKVYVWSLNVWSIPLACSGA